MNHGDLVYGGRVEDRVGSHRCPHAQERRAEAEVRAALAGQTGKGGNTSAAAMVGKRVAEKALKAGIDTVAFDRSGFRYHGRVKALAEAAREAGLQF